MNQSMGFFYVDYIKNPKYGKLDYGDPRNDEQWTQNIIWTHDVIADLLTRVEKLENKEN